MMYELVSHKCKKFHINNVNRRQKNCQVNLIEKTNPANIPWENEMKRNRKLIELPKQAYRVNRKK